MLSRWQSTIVDEKGNVQPLANLTVRNEADQSLAKMWASPGTTQPLPDGMVQADGNGYAFFYARGGLYRITSATLGIDWRHVPLGSAAARDVGTGPDETRTNGQNDSRFAQLAGGANADFTAMPEVGGSPIVESGSNANGSWTKWADGTMEQNGKTESKNDGAGVTTVYGVTFPVAFYSPPLVFAEIRSAVPERMSPSSSSGTTTSTVNIYVQRDNNTDFSLDWTAKGRWKA